MRMIMGLTVAALLTGCAVNQAELEKPVRAGDTIRFSAGPCFGTCPSYTLRVTPDGSGLIEPGRFTAVPGPTRFTVTPEQYRRFHSAIAPYRPAPGTTKRIAQGENCDRFATDMPAYVIEWAREKQATTRLEYQSGCMDARYGRLRAMIASVPQMLGLQAMLKPLAPSKSDT
ncbi:DUF6438 domain-containing protein [Sphingobium cloacae]|uniref:DUF6438 domain-containing protein n=1 Tax=Sphingobium cloacae TaxID=120107 RepID=A0A1E1F6J6_9SPHN|nr:DUF6438 domain-containing protein [Sphingobium cloacae]BAV66125.1 hypothetical protein SCLO_1030850 [Sphingobium cloacae]